MRPGPGSPARVPAPSWSPTSGCSTAGRATTHWLFADELRRRYPAVRVTADQMIVDNGDVITSGGTTAFLNLVLYLVERAD